MSFERYNSLTGKGRKAYYSDIGKEAKITNNINRWKRNPRMYDFIGIDTDNMPKGYIKKYNPKFKRRLRNKLQWTFKYPKYRIKKTDRMVGDKTYMKNKRYKKVYLKNKEVKKRSKRDPFQQESGFSLF